VKKEREKGGDFKDLGLALGPEGEGRELDAVGKTIPGKEEKTEREPCRGSSLTIGRDDKNGNHKGSRGAQRKSRRGRAVGGTLPGYLRRGQLRKRAKVEGRNSAAQKSRSFLERGGRDLSRDNNQ